MSEISETVDTSAFESRPSGEPAKAPPARSGGATLAWVVALLALVVAGVSLWRIYQIERGQVAAQRAAQVEIDARIDALGNGVDQRKRELESLRARVTDVDAVNRSVREELLGLGERSRHLEDAVANLAEQRLSGRDAMAMNEAEFLLQQAQERLALFGDAQAAMSAYRLADSALAATEDPVFTTVRATIGSELQALKASKPVETRAALATLARTRGSLAALPKPQAAAQPAAATSGWQGFLSRFVRVSHGNAGSDVFGTRDSGLARAIIAIDLRAAEAAVFTRDSEAFKSAIASARGGITSTYDPAAPAVKAVLADLERLAAMPLAPSLPELGSALKELRNLRATRSLAQPVAPMQGGRAPPAETPPASTEGDGT